MIRNARPLYPCWAPTVSWREITTDRTRWGIIVPMANKVESGLSEIGEQAKPTLPAWLKVGAVAAATALAGGIAAAWIYRKTLTKLRQEEDRSPDGGLGSPADDVNDEI